MQLRRIRLQLQSNCVWKRPEGPRARRNPSNCTPDRRGTCSLLVGRLVRIAFDVGSHVLDGGLRIRGDSAGVFIFRNVLGLVR